MYYMTLKNSFKQLLTVLLVTGFTNNLLMANPDKRFQKNILSNTRSMIQDLMITLNDMLYAGAVSESELRLELSTLPFEDCILYLEKLIPAEKPEPDDFIHPTISIEYPHQSLHLPWFEEAPLPFFTPEEMATEVMESANHSDIWSAYRLLIEEQSGYPDLHFEMPAGTEMDAEMPLSFEGVNPLNALKQQFGASVALDLEVPSISLMLSNLGIDIDVNLEEESDIKKVRVLLVNREKDEPAINQFWTKEMTAQQFKKLLVDDQLVVFGLPGKKEHHLLFIQMPFGERLLFAQLEGVIKINKKS
jgi:hypothetical protein